MAIGEPEQQGWTTYIRLPSDDETLPEQWPIGPGLLITDDSDDSLLRELRRRVVDPVVSSVLTAAEIGDVVVYRHRDQPQLRARVTAANGEVSEHYLTTDATLLADLAAVAAQFASELEDFVAESRFGWGQQRTARYVIVEPFTPPRFRDYLTELPSQETPPAHPAPDPGFVQDVVVMPLRHGQDTRWHAVWAVTTTHYEEFEGSETACIAWALARCINTRAWSTTTQHVEPVRGEAP